MSHAGVAAMETDGNHGPFIIQCPKRKRISHDFAIYNDLAIDADAAHDDDDDDDGDGTFRQKLR